MKISTVATLIIISSLLFLVRTDSIVAPSSENDMPVFQLMDLTELLKSLNVTFQDLAMNLSTLNSLNNLPSPSQLYQNQTNNSPSQPKSATNKTAADAVIPSQITTQDPKTVSSPKATSPNSNPSSSTPQKSGEPSSAAKPSNSSAQDPKPAKNIQPASTTSTSSSSSASTSSSSSSSNSPTFGPGPDNKSLPPVIDLTKMTVDYVAPASKPTISSPTTSSSTKTTTSTATQTTPQDNSAPSAKSTSAVRTNSNNNVNNLNSNSPNQSPSNAQSSPTVSPSTVATRTQTTTVSTQTSVQSTSSTPKTPQAPKNTPAAQTTDKNSVYLAPISTPAADPIRPNYQTQQTNQPQSSSSPPAASTSSSPSVSSNSDASAIYNITPAYKSFSPYFIITKTDPYLPSLRTYLLNNYGNYLSQGQIIAGFRVYNNNGDNSLDYQLLYSTFYGTFTTILTYWPDTSRIMLKTLSILNFFIMEIDYSNCRSQDLAQQNCKVCNDGYRNFMGRCRALDPFCSRYLSDQCGACSEGRRLLNGQCQ